MSVFSNFEQLTQGVVKAESDRKNLRRLVDHAKNLSEDQLQNIKCELPDELEPGIDDRLLGRRFIFRDGRQLDINAILKIFDDYETRSEHATSVFDHLVHGFDVEEENYGGEEHRVKMTVLYRAAVRALFSEYESIKNSSVPVHMSNGRYTRRAWFLKEFFDICPNPNAAEKDLLKRTMFRRAPSTVDQWFSDSQSKLAPLLLLRDVLWTDLRVAIPVKFLQTGHGHNNDKDGCN